MATIKKISKAKNLSAGPSKKTPIAPKVDPKGQYTKVQERTLGNMKKGGKIRKYQNSGPAIKASADNTRISKRNPVAEQKAKTNKAVSNFTKSGVSNKKSANDWNYSKFDYVTRKGWDDIAEGLKKRANEYDSTSKEDFRRADSAKASLKKILPEKKKGGTVKAKDGKWIQKAINPKHKGYCTPETKATCTPKRKALAHTLRKMAKKK